MSNRTFTVVDARGTDGCATKYSIKGHGGRYHGTHERAAKRAFNILCRVKKIKGQCAMIISVRETTRGSDGKVLTYKCRREKLENPLVLPNGITVNYKTVAYAFKQSMPACKGKLPKSPGPMKAKKGKKTMKFGLDMQKMKKTKRAAAPADFFDKFKKGKKTMKFRLDMQKMKKTKKENAPTGFFNKLKKMI